MKPIAKIIFVALFSSFSSVAFAAEDQNSVGAAPIPPWIFTIAIGVSVGIGLTIHNLLQSKRNRNLSIAIEPVLRRGPSTLAEVAEAVHMGGFYAKGKVALCLQQMIREGRVVVTPAPEGTPQLQKVNHIKYVLQG